MPVSRQFEHQFGSVSGHHSIPPPAIPANTKIQAKSFHLRQYLRENFGVGHTYSSYFRQLSTCEEDKRLVQESEQLETNQTESRKSTAGPLLLSSLAAIRLEQYHSQYNENCEKTWHFIQMLMPCRS